MLRVCWKKKTSLFFFAYTLLRFSCSKRWWLSRNFQRKCINITQRPFIDAGYSRVSQKLHYVIELLSLVCLLSLSFHHKITSVLQHKNKKNYMLTMILYSFLFNVFFFSLSFFLVVASNGFFSPCIHCIALVCRWVHPIPSMRSGNYSTLIFFQQKAHTRCISCKCGFYRSQNCSHITQMTVDAIMWREKKDGCVACKH